MRLTAQNNKMEEKELIKKAKGWHQYVVSGLVKGLSHTSRDERLHDIDWVRKRLALFESFSRCIMDTICGNDNQYNEKELKEVAEEGYKLNDSQFEE